MNKKMDELEIPAAFHIAVVHIQMHVQISQKTGDNAATAKTVVCDPIL